MNGYRVGQSKELTACRSVGSTLPSMSMSVTGSQLNFVQRRVRQFRRIHRQRIVYAEEVDTSNSTGSTVRSPSAYLAEIRAEARKYKQKSKKPDDAGNNQRVMKRVLGVDYGTHMTGLAFQIYGLWTAKPLPAIKSKEFVYETAKEILQIGLKHRVQGFVVGIPPRDGGNIKHHWTDSRNARRCRSFAFTLAQFAREHKLKVLLYNENFTTLNVRLSKNLSWRKMTGAEKRDVDSAVATLILNSYYEHPEDAFEIKPEFDKRYMMKKYNDNDMK